MISCVYNFNVLIFFLTYNFPTIFSFFFFNDTATTEIYTLSLHDALPISRWSCYRCSMICGRSAAAPCCPRARSEEHTSELQSLTNLVCRLLLEKKKKNIYGK